MCACAVRDADIWLRCVRYAPTHWRRDWWHLAVAPLALPACCTARLLAATEILLRGAGHRRAWLARRDIGAWGSPLRQLPLRCAVLHSGNPLAGPTATVLTTPRPLTSRSQLIRAHTIASVITASGMRLPWLRSPAAQLDSRAHAVHSTAGHTRRHTTLPAAAAAAPAHALLPAAGGGCDIDPGQR